MKTNKKRNRALLYAIGFLQGMVFYAPIATLYRTSRGLSVFDITLIESISLAVALLLELPWGWLADRIGYKRTLVVCSGLFFLSKMIFWRAHSFGMFLRERLVLSVVLAGLSGCDMGFLYLCAPENGAKRAFALYESSSMAGAMLACAAFSLLLGGRGESAAFWTIVTYFWAFFLSFFLDDKGISLKGSRPKGSGLIAVKEMLRGVGWLLPFLISSALLAETSQNVTVFLCQLQYVKCGAPQNMLGLYAMLVMLAGSLGFLALRLAEKIGPSRFCLLVFFTAAGACAVLAVTRSLAVSLFCLFLLRFCAASFVPLGNEVQNRCVPAAFRVTSLSAFSVVASGVGVAAGPAFGAVSLGGVSGGMVLGAAFCLFSAALFPIWGKKAFPWAED